MKDVLYFNSHNAMKAIEWKQDIPIIVKVVEEWTGYWIHGDFQLRYVRS